MEKIWHGSNRDMEETKRRNENAAYLNREQKKSQKNKSSVPVRVHNKALERKAFCYFRDFIFCFGPL